MSEGPRVKLPSEEEQVEINKEQKKLSLKFPSILEDQQAFKLGRSAMGTVFARAKAVIKESQGVELSTKQKQRYGEALATVGAYEKAYEITGDEKYKKISEIDESLCECPDISTTTLKNGRPEHITFSRHYIKQRIYIKGKWRSLQACNRCQHLSLK